MFISPKNNCRACERKVEHRWQLQQASRSKLWKGILDSNVIFQVISIRKYHVWLDIVCTYLNFNRHRQKCAIYCNCHREATLKQKCNVFWIKQHMCTLLYEYIQCINHRYRVDMSSADFWKIISSEHFGSPERICLIAVSARCHCCFKFETQKLQINVSTCTGERSYPQLLKTSCIPLYLPMTTFSAAPTFYGALYWMWVWTNCHHVSDVNKKIILTLFVTPCNSQGQADASFTHARSHFVHLYFMCKTNLGEANYLGRRDIIQLRKSSSTNRLNIDVKIHLRGTPQPGEASKCTWLILLPVYTGNSVRAQQHENDNFFLHLQDNNYGFPWKINI